MNKIENLINQLPIDIIRHINSFGGGHRETFKPVLEELTNFIDDLPWIRKQVYIYKKPNALLPKDTYLQFVYTIHYTL